MRFFEHCLVQKLQNCQRFVKERQLFLFNVPKHFFIISTRKFLVFLKNMPHKKSIKLERLRYKDKSFQKFPTTVQFAQRILQRRKKTNVWTSDFYILQENPFIFPFECVQRHMMTFRMNIVKLHWDAFKSTPDVHKIHLQRQDLPIPLFHLILST